MLLPHFWDMILLMNYALCFKWYIIMYYVQGIKYHSGLYTIIHMQLEICLFHGIIITLYVVNDISLYIKKAMMICKKTLVISYCCSLWPFGDSGHMSTIPSKSNNDIFLKIYTSLDCGLCWYIMHNYQSSVSLSCHNLHWWSWRETGLNWDFLRQLVWIID